MKDEGGSVALNPDPMSGMKDASNRGPAFTLCPLLSDATRRPNPDSGQVVDVEFCLGR